MSSFLKMNGTKREVILKRPTARHYDDVLNKGSLQLLSTHFPFHLAITLQSDRQFLECARCTLQVARKNCPLIEKLRFLQVTISSSLSFSRRRCISKLIAQPQTTDTMV